MGDLFEKGSAVFSPCGQYRYRLSRTWAESGPRAVFIMLNPSTATAEVSDPTVTRCGGFARRWGAAGFEVVNLFAYRSPYPEDLWRQADPVGPENDAHVLQACCGRDATWVVAAWGAACGADPRARKVMAMLRQWGVRLQCLGVTKAGRPRHPLYLKADTPLEDYPGRAAAKLEKDVKLESDSFPVPVQGSDSCLSSTTTS